MNTKIASFVLMLSLTAVACNALMPHIPSIPKAAEALTVSPPPTATPDLTKPRIIGTLPKLKYSSDPNTTNMVFGDFPHTHPPASANLLAVSFHLEFQEGWTARNVALRSPLYQYGTLLDGWGGSSICKSANPCDIITSRRFSSSGFEEGQYEVRLYLGDELLDGPQSKVWLTADAWEGDLHVMNCDTLIGDICNDVAGQIPIFSTPVTIPTDRNAVQVINAFANLPSGTSWNIDLNRADCLISSQTQILSGEEPWSGWRISQLSDPHSNTLQPGTYVVKLIWKGGLVETVSFEVRQKNI